MKKAKDCTLCFESELSPQDFIERAHDIVLSENYHYFSRNENGFLFQINANHGGKVFFNCEISPDDNGGSIINGTIIHQSWYADEKQNIMDKIRDTIIIVLTCVVFFPILIFVGISNLVLRLSKKKNLSPDEKKAVDFMTNKMGCTQKEESE